METSWSSATASTSKPRATSFFPLQKLKGTQLDVTPSAQMVHLEEKSANEEKSISGEDPDGIEGMTEEFNIHLARAVKGNFFFFAQQKEKHCYHCDSPYHFIHDYPWLAGTKADEPFNQKEGTVPRKGG